MKILVIGNAAYDITFPLDKFPEENTKNRNEDAYAKMCYFI